MKELLQKVAGVNWTTNIPGVLGVVCGSAELLNLLPPDYALPAMKVCLILTSLGLIAAKSSNVSNSPNPVPSQPVK